MRLLCNDEKEALRSAPGEHATEWLESGRVMQDLEVMLQSVKTVTTRSVPMLVDDD